VIRSTQPCIPPESINRVLASAGVEAGKSPLPGYMSLAYNLMSCNIRPYVGRNYKHVCIYFVI